MFFECVGVKAIQGCAKILSKVGFDCIGYGPVYNSKLPGVMKRDGHLEFEA